MAKTNKLKKESGVIKVKGRRGIVFLSRPSLISLFFTGVAGASLVFFLTLTGIPVIPMIWYNLKPELSSRVATTLKAPVQSLQDDFPELKETPPLTAYLPPQDPSLPQENRLRIPSIGVDAPIIPETVENYENALRQGVWLPPNLGTPDIRGIPMILAAHRFGYIAWSNEFRRQNSFFNLPKVKVGDQIEVIWGQRKYVYEVYQGDEGTEVTDIGADLILSTCKFLEGPIRIFRYARLIEG